MSECNSDKGAWFGRLSRVFLLMFLKSDFYIKPVGNMVVSSTGFSIGIANVRNEVPCVDLH